MAALNACQEADRQGANKKIKNKEDNDSLGNINISKIATCQDIFFGLPKEEIVKIFKIKFKPMNLYKLRHFHGFQDTREKVSINVKNNFFRLWKTIDTYKNFDKNINEV